MRLYRIMLVDDEEEIRLGIIKKIDWESNGFVVVGDAENGHDALEKAEKLQPDVVMTDIKMPFMDGLELGRKLSERMPSTKVIIFSGSDDIEYAHQAIKINVIEYVLKPVSSTELTEVLQRLKKQLDREYEEKRNVETLYQHYIESLPVLREQLLVGLIEGRVTKYEWDRQSKAIGIDLKFKHWIVSLIHVDTASISDEAEYISLQNESTLIPFAVQQIIEDSFSNKGTFISFIYCGRVVVIANYDESEKVLDLIQGINEVCKTAERIIGFKVSAGIGHICENISDIYMSYRSAQNALDYRVVLGTGKSIYIGDVEPDNTVKLHFSDNKERVMLNAIKIGSSSEITEIIGDLFKEFEELLLPFNQYKIYLMEIMTSLLKVVQAYQLDIEEVFGENFDCYSYINTFDSLSKIKEWFIEVGVKVNKMIRRERIYSSKLLVEKAKRYVAENYHDYEISVDTLCSELHVSPTYFSTIFKRETEMGFVNFLTSVRLDEAVKLLNTTDDKTYVIAEKVGYGEANYFSYVFKKKYGVSPSKYRNTRVV